MPKKIRPANNPASDPLGGLLGGLLGGGQASQGQGQGGDVLGGLLGGGQQGGAPSGGSLSDNSFLGPIIDSLAAKFGVSPQIAGAVVTIALTYLAGNAGGAAAQKARKGKVSRKFLQESGLVDQLQQQTGLDSTTAVASLSQVFQAFGTQTGGGQR